MRAFTKVTLLPSGITLLEFLVASALSLFITELIYTMYTKVMSKVACAYSKIDVIENQRFATYFLFKQIERAQKVLVENVKVPMNFVCGTEYLVLQQLLKDHNSFKVIPVLYYIGDTHRLKSNRKIYSLYMKKGTSPAEEVIEGVEKIGIRYGIKCVNSSNICRYSLKKEVKKYDEIGAIQCELTLASYENSMSEKTQHKWLIYICIKS